MEIDWFTGVEAGNQEEHGNENGLLKSMPTTQQVHNANVVSIPTDETGVPGVISVSNTQAPEELLPSNPLSSRKSTSGKFCNPNLPLFKQLLIAPVLLCVVCFALTSPSWLASFEAGCSLLFLVTKLETGPSFVNICS